MKKKLTSRNNKHTHTWSWKNKRTSVDAGHSHKLSFNKMLALKGKTNHSHKLLKGR